MNLIQDIAKVLLGMFLGDARLTVAILALVIVVAVLVVKIGATSLIGGGLLLAGCLTILVCAALFEARRQ